MQIFKLQPKHVKHKVCMQLGGRSLVDSIIHSHYICAEDHHTELRGVYTTGRDRL
uniref:Uncharacterized protein n=1 Tax=Anguilla anguilla TaxID=7936 RepID=A0A0E9SGB9_ANGAN